MKPITPPSNVSAEDLKRSVKLRKAWSRGELIDPDKLPRPMSLLKQLSEEQIAALPDFILIHGGWCLVSERAADVLKGFKLGCTQFIETPIFEQDQVTQRPERFFLLNVAEHKSGFDRENSTNWSLERKRRSDRPGQELWSVIEQKGIAIDASAAEGVDLWFDHKVLNLLFLSDRLAKAIKAAKLKRHGLQPCIVVED